MIGRDAELDLLRWALERASRAQRPHLVTVIGQPGIGKSRLVAELPRLGDGLTDPDRSVPGDHRVVVARASARGGAGRDPRRRAAPRRASHELMPGDQDAAAVAACLRRGAGAPDVAWAVSRLIGALAETRTVVVAARGRALGERPPPRHRRAAARGQPPPGAPRRLHREAGAFGPAAGVGDGAPTRSRSRSSASTTPTPGACSATRARVSRPSRPSGSSPRPRATRSSPSIWRRWSATRPRRRASRGRSRCCSRLGSRRCPSRSRRSSASRPSPAGTSRRPPSRLWSAGRSTTSSTGSPSASSSSPRTVGRHRFGHALLQDAAYGLLPEGAAERAPRRAGRLARRATGRATRWSATTSSGRTGSRRSSAWPATRLRVWVRRPERGWRPRAAEPTRWATRGGRASSSSGPSTCSPSGARSARRRWSSWRPPAGTCFPREELSSLLADGADLAAELGARAVELRARVLRLGAVPETSSEAVNEREVIVQTNAALAELEAMDAPRAVATALCARSEAEWWLGRAADAVASVRRAIGVLRDVDEDSVWALAILCSAVVDSPMPVSEAEGLLAGLMVELGSPAHRPVGADPGAGDAGAASRPGRRGVAAVRRGARRSNRTSAARARGASPTIAG